MSWWNNLSELQTYYGRVQWGLGLSGLVTAFLIVISLRWNDRIGVLQDKERDVTALRISKNEHETTAAVKDAAIANKAAAEANAKVASANVRIAELEIGRAQADKGAAQARLELEKIKNPRTIAPWQNVSFREFVASAEKGKIEIEYFSSEEASEYARQIAMMLSISGYDVPTELDGMSHVLAGTRMESLSITVFSPNNAIAIGLQQGLAHVGIQASARVIPAPPYLSGQALKEFKDKNDAVIRLYVGVKSIQ